MPHRDGWEIEARKGCEQLEEKMKGMKPILVGIWAMLLRDSSKWERRMTMIGTKCLRQFKTICWI